MVSIDCYHHFWWPKRPKPNHLTGCLRSTPDLYYPPLPIHPPPPSKKGIAQNKAKSTQNRQTKVKKLISQNTFYRCLEAIHA